MKSSTTSGYWNNNPPCYNCAGRDLRGNNVTYKADKNRSCWVDDNSYTVVRLILRKQKPQVIRDSGFVC
jgi:hypothetical protein